jgi:cyclic dehypoxanthinyl futalosine synthase
MLSTDSIRSGFPSGFDRARRLEPREALWLLRQAPLLRVGELASEARQWHVPGDRVTFVVDANPNYTNVCDTYCSFCSFYRRPGDTDAYAHPVETLVATARSARARGATRLLLQGGHNPELPFAYYLELVAGLREACPDLELHMFSPPEIRAIAGYSGRSVSDVLERLFEAGLRTLPGGGAEVLSARVRRRISRLKGTPDDWIDVMRTAHRVGFRTTATLMYGHVEEDEDIVEHLERLRRLQDETGGFFAFIPWSFKPGASPLSRQVRRPAGPGRYLRLLGVSRLYLDNFPHVQASWFSEGEKAGQLGLHFGADDFGGTLIEENVLRAAGHRVTTSTERVAHVIQDAGFTAVERNTLYEPLRVHAGGAR